VRAVGRSGAARLLLTADGEISETGRTEWLMLGAVGSARSRPDLYFGMSTDSFLPRTRAFCLGAGTLPRQISTFAR